MNNSHSALNRWQKADRLLFTYVIINSRFISVNRLHLYILTVITIVTDVTFVKILALLPYFWARIK